MAFLEFTLPLDCGSNEAVCEVDLAAEVERVGETFTIARLYSYVGNNRKQAINGDLQHYKNKRFQVWRPFEATDGTFPALLTIAADEYLRGEGEDLVWEALKPQGWEAA